MPGPDLKHDPTELVILCVLAEEPLYGYAITKRVAGQSGGEIKLSPGVLYPLLNLMEKQALIASTWETVKSDRAAGEAGGEADSAEAGEGGRRRKWYRLSPKGRKRLVQRIEAHKAYLSMIESFLPGAPKGAEGGRG
jgi:PadR family transcriptional regulator PadR